MLTPTHTHTHTHTNVWLRVTLEVISSHLLSRNSMMGCSTLSASWATLLALPTLAVPFT